MSVTIRRCILICWTGNRAVADFKELEGLLSAAVKEAPPWVPCAGLTQVEPPEAPPPLTKGQWEFTSWLGKGQWVQEALGYNLVTKHRGEHVPQPEERLGLTHRNTQGRSRPQWHCGHPQMFICIAKAVGWAHSAGAAPGLTASGNWLSSLPVPWSSWMAYKCLSWVIRGSCEMDQHSSKCMFSVILNSCCPCCGKDIL